MRPRVAWVGLLISLLIIGGVVGTTGVQAKPLAGYRCMMLNLSEQQSMDPSLRVPVQAAPSTSAPTVGWAGAVVVVREPVTPVNGFVQMLYPDGRQVWIASNALRPYHSLGDPNAKCVPEILPNGRIGFGTHG
jgi:hypothetical protein